MGNLGKLIAAKGFKKVAQSPINCPIWSHWPELTKYHHFGDVLQVFGNFDRQTIEHCIIGEAIFITSSPHFLVLFITMKKIILFIDIEQAISQ